MPFHITPKGEAKHCRAKTGNCPFGATDEHYSSAEQARVVAEVLHATFSGESLLPTAYGMIKVSPGRLDKAALTALTSGVCANYALLLHAETGYPPMVFFDQEPRTSPSGELLTDGFIHAGVQTPEGYFLDAYGVRKPEEYEALESPTRRLYSSVVSSDFLREVSYADGDSLQNLLSPFVEKSIALARVGVALPHVTDGDFQNLLDEDIWEFSEEY